ncbi:hypothetical protein L1277_000258 [Okibacterium sp. HSC-33S16]|uniref:hypothetical protein n=1 Tax=Okibacterium sp. HSC-33S16 TaxID=2910965 RepID=UPI00209EAD78|nr:hypothetical protein [Okibacterium sp. HSC-33S16]MCP2030194.1 hypothetical protein [Okibacterium sp. HSC-33S16]
MSHSAPPEDPRHGEPVDPDVRRVRRVPGSRRAVLPPVPGTDPTPQAQRDIVLATEDKEQGWGGRPSAATGPAGANDAQLRADVPPHWG